MAYYNFRKANMAALNEYLSMLDFDSKINKVGVNVVVEQLYDVLSTGISLFVLVSYYKSRIFPIWFISNLTQLVIQKKIAHTKI